MGPGLQPKAGRTEAEAETRVRFWSLSAGMHCAPALGSREPAGAGAAPTAAPSGLEGSEPKRDSSARPGSETPEEAERARRCPATPHPAGKDCLKRLVKIVKCYYPRFSFSGKRRSFSWCPGLDCQRGL